MAIDDLKSEWLDLARRLQSVVGRNGRYGLIIVTILHDKDGRPVFWTSPRQIGIEPKSSDFLDILLENLATDI